MSDGEKQGGYPEQAAPPPYAAQPGGYPAQQGAYPAQQGAYPAQQGAYPPQQGGYPPQQGAYPPPPQPYVQPTVVVVANNSYVLSKHPQNMNCSNCHAQIQTCVNYEFGTMTWLICAILFFFTGICCFIPFLIDDCKDAIHTCPACKSFIGRKNAM